MPYKSNNEKAGALFVRADKEEERGNLRSAFRLMLAAAKLGDAGAQVNVGNYYDDAIGVRRNRSAALYWYKRACRRGESSAASNLGVLYRKEGRLRRSLYWFFRAVTLGDDEANLQIAKHYLLNERNIERAIPHLERVIRAKCVTEAGVEEAKKLLARAKKGPRGYFANRQSGN